MAAGGPKTADSARHRDGTWKNHKSEGPLDPRRRVAEQPRTCWLACLAQTIAILGTSSIRGAFVESGKKRLLVNPRWLRYRPVVLSLSYLLFGVAALYAQDDFWIGETGSWFSVSNWTTGVGVPTNAVNAFVNNGGTAQIAENAAAAKSLTIGGGSTVELSSGGQLATGAVVVNGTFDISQGGNQTIGDLSGSGTVDLGARQLTAGTANSTTFTGTINDGGLAGGTGGSLVKQGAGTLTLTGTNIYTGGTTINAGTLQLGNGGTSGSIVGKVVNNGSLIFDRSDALTFGGVISGTGSVTQVGTGTLKLTGANTYSGGTNLKGGALAVNSDANLGSGSLHFDGGTLEVLAGGGLFSGKGISLGAGGGTFLVDAGTRSALFGAITGPGALTKAGAGTLTLTGTNTYTGGNIISAGTLALAGELAPGGAVVVGNGGTFDISLGGIQTIGDLNGSGTVNLGENQLTVGTANNTTFSGTIEDGGDGGSLVKQGAGTLTLTGANTYTGGTTINAGTLAVSRDANLGEKGSLSPLSFNGGTLEALAAGGGLTSSKAVTVAAGGGTFLADAGTASVLSGTISGPGAWTKAGAGTLKLTGANTYSGGTNLNGGVLAVNSDANLGTGPLSFNGGTLESLAAGGGLTSTKAVTLAAGGGTFLADVGTDSTLSGTITGQGALTKAGPGGLTLTGAKTYTGGTIISAGTLALNGGELAPTGAVVDNGTFDISQSGNQTIGDLSGSGTVKLGARQLTAGTADSTAFSGTIQDGGLGGGTGGSLVKQGTGTLTLTGANTYTGGTTINAGTLQLGNGGTSGSIVGNVVNNGILIFDRSDTLTFAGVISGTGSVTQGGTGTLILTGDNTYTGATTVAAGRLLVDGSIVSPLTTVHAGGLLGGHGALGGSLVNTGIVSPGGSIGTLTVAGNYTQTAGGTFRIEVAGVAPGAYDLLVVNGHASLAGTLQLIPVGGFQLHVGDRISFLTAAGGVSGTFGTVENGFNTGTIVNAQVIYLPTAVLLAGTQGSFVPAACNPNSAAVARSLDAAVGDPRAAGLIAFLDNEPFDRLCRDFELIAPEELTAVDYLGIAWANVQTTNLERRLEDVQCGSTGFSASGFSFTLSGGASGVSAGLAGVSGPEGKEGPPGPAPVPENRWGIFVTGVGEFTSVGNTADAAGFDVRTGGVTLGADYRLGSNLAVGLLGGYANAGVDLANGGSLEVNGGKLGLYGTTFSCGSYLDAAVIGGRSAYDSRRATLLGLARGSTDGSDLSALVAGGYDWKLGGLSVGPTASFQYTWVGVDGFTEQGSLAPLKIDDQHAESKRTALGAKASYDWKVGGLVVTPELRASWQHEFGQTQYAVASSFASGAGTGFSVTGPSIGHDSLLIGAGVLARWNDRFAIFAYYDGEFGRANYDSNSVSAGVRVFF
jgi:fibronectin-binding autotransporter adhesin